MSGSGLLVAIVGPDGSGKTTLADALEDRLRLSFTAVERIRSTFGILPTLRQLAGLARGERLPRSRPTTVGVHHQGMGPPRSVPRALTYVGYYSWDFALARPRVARARAAGHLLLADRYVHDFYYQRAYRRLPWRVIATATCLAPRPDLTIVLDGDPAAIHARKPELSAEEIAYELAVIRTVAPRLGPTCTIRCDAGVERMTEEACRQVLDRLS